MEHLWWSSLQKYNPCPLYSDVWTLRILYALLLKCKYNFGITENETQIQPYLLQYLLHSIRQPIFIQVWEKKSYHWEKWIVLRKKKIYIYIYSTFSRHIQHKVWLHYIISSISHIPNITTGLKKGKNITVVSKGAKTTACVLRFSM